MNDPHRQSQLETPCCPMCNGRESRIRYQWPIHEPMRVRRCRDCHFHYLAPRPTERRMHDLYRGADYYQNDGGDGYSGYAEQERALRLTFARLLQHLDKRGLTSGALLEVGCGYGYLLAESQRYFEERTATDFSTDAAARAAQYARVYAGGLEQLPDKTYDMVISNHVIEHVHHPHEFMANITAKVRPGGHLLLSTPDMGGWWRRVLGARWPSFKIPEHLLYFDRPALQRLFEKHGYSQIQRVPYPHAFPLTLVAAKLGVRLPAAAAKWSLWIPGTTVAMIGRR